MLALYLFALVLGGGFLLLSVLGGGDADVDVDLDMDMEGLDGAAEAGGDGDAASRIFSLRTAVYALFGFGATGTILAALGMGSLTTLPFSLLGGLGAALVVSLAFRFLRRTDSGAQAGEGSLRGLPGVVTLPLGTGSPGTVAVERGGRRITLRALPHPASRGEPRSWTRVVVVEMERGVALVSPLEPDEMEALGSGEDPLPG